MAYLGRQRPTETTSSVLRSTYTGNGSTTTYALPGPVANETSIIATINGVTQQDAAYSTDGSNIIFAAAPALNDAIELRTISAVGLSYAPYAGSVTTGILADGAVTTGKIADNSITTAKIADNAITSAKLGFDVILAENIAANAITVAEIANGAVTSAKLASGVAGTGPAFSASSSGNTSASNATWTKLQLNTELFDTNSNFDSTTNYRFTPTITGYYQVNAQVLTPSNANLSQVGIFKNGAVFAFTTFYHATTGVTNCFPVSTVVYLNGSTDYIELYGWQQAGTTLPAGAVLSGCLVRSA